MNHLKFVAAWLVLAAGAEPTWAQTPSAPQAPSRLLFATQATGFEQAMLHYEASQWAAAFDVLAELADQGHAEASRMALQMGRYGPQLYGQPFAVAQERRARWLASAMPARLVADRR